MRCFSAALAVALAACAPRRVAPDGIALGTSHPLLHAVAPRLTGVDLEGRALDEDKLTGCISVVRFWARWSPGARESLVSLARISDRFSGRGVCVVGVSIDHDPHAAGDLALIVGARFTLAWDPQHELARRWLVSHVPSTFVLDTAGIVRAVFVDDAASRVEPAIDDDVEILLGRSTPRAPPASASSPQGAHAGK